MSTLETTVARLMESLEAANSEARQQGEQCAEAQSHSEALAREVEKLHSRLSKGKRALEDCKRASAKAVR